MNNKRQYESIHAKKRALERYGLNFNRKTRLHFLETIKNGEAQLIKRLTNTRLLLKIFQFYVIYNKNTKNIITFLTHEMVEDSWAVYD